MFHLGRGQRLVWRMMFSAHITLMMLSHLFLVEHPECFKEE